MLLDGLVLAFVSPFPHYGGAPSQVTAIVLFMDSRKGNLEGKHRRNDLDFLS